jgi:IS1 family transposase
MNNLSIERQVQILSALVEGNSIRATSRMTYAAKNTIIRLLCNVGEACRDYQNATLRNLTCKRIQCDEVWSFVWAKRKNVPARFEGYFGYGDVWTFTALDADTKLIPAWHVGSRDFHNAWMFIHDLASRIKNRVQLTTDGANMYLQAVEGGFWREIDYAMLVKIYQENTPEEQRRYSPAVCIGAEKRTICGNPEPNGISTSYVERSNLSLRMGNRRFTRLTNAFSRKVENLEHSLALHFMHYNFCRKHQTLKTTPAVAAGVADHIWSLYEVARLAYPESARLAA